MNNEAFVRTVFVVNIFVILLSKFSFPVSLYYIHIFFLSLQFPF